MTSLNHLAARDLSLPLDTYPHIPVTATVRDAFLLMRSRLAAGHRYRSLLVFDDDNLLLGYVSLRELLLAIDPHYAGTAGARGDGRRNREPQENDIAALSVMWQENLDRKVRSAARSRVGQVMTAFKLAVTPADPLVKCVHQMLALDLYLLPIAEDEQVSGIIRLVDVFDRLADALFADFAES